MVIDRYIPLADIIFNKLKISDFIIVFSWFDIAKNPRNKTSKLSGKEIQEIQI